MLEAKTGDQRGHDVSVLSEAQNRSIGPVAVVGIGCWFPSVEGCPEAKFRALRETPIELKNRRLVCA